MLDIKKYVVDQLGRRYWIQGKESILRLPIPRQEITDTLVSPRMVLVKLPDWANEYSIEGSFLVPEWAINYNIPEERRWQHIDWFSTIFWYLNAVPERQFEKNNGSIHSYSLKLNGWNPRIWERAWVNRIALFLRKWATRFYELDEDRIFSKLPAYKIHVTHDVDAIEKTLSIRLKQSAFNLFNAVRASSKFEFKECFSKTGCALRFLFSLENYWFFDYILSIETRHNITSYFNFFSGKIGCNRSWKEALFDPGYDILSAEIRRKISTLESLGHKIGLHSSFNTWNNKELMLLQKKRLEQCTNTKVTICRQHWLRFSWEDTWRIQEEIGLEQDLTLGFNDRAGFRNSAALAFNPWNNDDNQPHSLLAIPTVFMDSHFYDYQSFSMEEIKRNLNYWLNEIKQVNGEAAIIWHQQVMGKDYGWRNGFEHVLSSL